MKSVLLMLLLGTAYVQAACFNFVGNSPDQVGPVKLFAPAGKVCVTKVSGFAGVYYSVTFADDQGDLAQFASKTETLMRCPGFCREYVLTSGNANGKNVNPANTRVRFHVEAFNLQPGTEGTLSISGAQYRIRK